MIMSADAEPTPAERDDADLITTSRERSKDVGSDSDTSTSDDETPSSEQATEWLATGRKRRSTAGNRMKFMLANEEPDSDLELLFAEDDDDQGFSEVGDDASDVHMDSSSDDDEDDKNGAQVDELEGEKELERKEKAQRAAARKRKATDAIPSRFRKKVRVDATPQRQVVPPPAPRPKKKSERTSWLPTTSELPTRASSRSTTRMSKEQLHAQMEEREARRLKQMEHMAKKAAKAEAMKKPPMTQEERLREAALVEKRNAKSLNRWEEAEKSREEERKAKLAALNNRTLKGPVITFWSGTRAWKDGGLTSYVVMEEKPKRKERKPKDKDKDKAKPDGSGETPVTNGTGPPKEIPSKTENGNVATPVKEEQGTSHQTNGTLEVTEPQIAQPSAVSPPTTTTTNGLAAPVPGPASTTAVSENNDNNNDNNNNNNNNNKASAVLAAPVLAAPAGVDPSPSAPPPNHPDTPKSSVLAAPTPQPSEPPTQEQTSQKQTPHQPVAASDGPVPPVNKLTPPVDKPITPTENGTGATLTEAPEPPSAATATGETAPESTTTATRNTIIYQNFDENAIKDKSIQTQVLFGRKMTKLAKPTAAPVCAITNHPARYHDPETGLPYYNAYAYREIHRLIRGNYKFSGALGAWAGSGTYAAKGVPERFLNPAAKSEKQKMEETKAQEQQQQATESKVNGAHGQPAQPAEPMEGVETTDALRTTDQIKQVEAVQPAPAAVNA
ncbi:YL1 nuclear protein-domain-containing protein [Emericellopsis atlantica]|uniref:YL1 nuclear protein-domain-containing protein n=1 Tax=Emericellopsis atlantica TaxID=2614577 RepID=A0A9P8CMU1_9HYPO|nr:YL1 nuclear protein-domain-containing protein [Emericellopsis atlantica]KAG9252793.1 YL1 nuclear protein-domain-containing protein [Emericellopsis atlantica]